MRRFALIAGISTVSFWLAAPGFAQAPREGGGAPQGGGAAAQGERDPGSAPQGRGAGPQGRGAGAQGRGAAAEVPLTRSVALETTSHTVEDLDRTVEFYKAVFGFIPFAANGRPLLNSAMSKLTDTPGATYRQAVLRLPYTGVVLRLMEFTGVERTTVKGGLTDSGQVGLRLFVGDMDAALVALQKAKAEILVPAPAPAGRRGAGRAGAAATTSPALIVARDPDGYWLQIEHGEGEPPSNIGAAAVSVLNTRVILVTADTDKKMAFYKDLLGMDLSAGTWRKMPAGPGEIRQSISKDFGGANRTIELCEYRNAGPSAPVKGRLQDAGTTMVSFIVRDLDDTLKALKDASLPIVSTNGESVTLAKLQRIIVRDPDGTYVELVQE